jgi:hypothetical protein
MMPELYTVSVGEDEYKVKDPVVFKSLIAKGYEPQKAFAMVDEIVDAVSKIFDGMCLALTWLPAHKIEYIHPCADGAEMVMLIEKRYSS